MQSTYTETSSSSNQRFNGNGHPDSPRSPNSHWKSIFRLPNSSSKKLNIHNTSLALDTQFDSTTERIASNTHSTAPSLATASHISDQRSSCNSSYSQSSDSNSVATSRTPLSSTSQNNSYPAPSNQHQPTTKEVPSPVPPFNAVPTKKNTKSEKQRLTSSRSHGQVSRPRVQITNIPPPLGISKPPSRSKTSTPLSPKAMGASASRFIRRVASAPNAKGLFTLGSRSGSSTRNGLLAPDDVPPVPPLIIEKGVDSLETTSSSSSKGRLRPPPSAPVTPINGSGAREPPAFRRTYSSNSIKVRQVSACRRARGS